MTTALEDAATQGRVPQVALTHGYYRQPNGWITVSPVTELEELRYRREGWEPLPAYGRVEMVSEYAVDHPLEALFMFEGARELSLEQIIESGLHLNPPVVPTCGTVLNQNHKRHTELCWRDAKPVTFPQLEEVPEGFQCRFCERNPFPTDKARDQHEGVMHKDEKSDIRTGQTLADSLVEGLTKSQAPIPAVAVNHPYLCGHCGKGYDHPIKLAQHVKKQHKESADGAEEAEGEGEGTPEAEG